MTGDGAAKADLADLATLADLADLATLATMWIGPRLPEFHRLCVSSWIALGHRVRFYSYDVVENLPDGVEICDAEAVLPRARLDDPALKIPTVIKSDIWRWAMFQQGGGVWCDADLFLVRPIPEPSRLLLAREERGPVCIAVMWWPADHPGPAYVLDVFDRVGLGAWCYAKPRWKRLQRRLTGRTPDFLDYPWNHWGRHAAEYLIYRHGLWRDVLDYRAFYWPVVYSDYLFRANPYRHILGDPHVYGLHCFRKSDGWLAAAPPGSFFHDARAALSAGDAVLSLAGR